MRRQEGLQTQILRSRLHEFCCDLDMARGCSSSRRRRQYVASGSRAATAACRIVFSEGDTTPAIPHSAKTRRVVTSWKGNLKAPALPSLA
ncbi:hypothetical protein ACOMHN_063192 [Nucella lapillus]